MSLPATDIQYYITANDTSLLEHLSGVDERFGREAGMDMLSATVSMMVMMVMMVVMIMVGQLMHLCVYGIGGQRGSIVHK